MCLRTCVVLLLAMAQPACVSGVVDGKFGGLVFNLKSIALRTIQQQYAVDNPHSVLPQITLYEFVAVFSDQKDVCADMQQHIQHKNSKQFQIALGRVDETGRTMNPVEDATYDAMDVATLRFADDALKPPIKTFIDGYSNGLFFVLDDHCSGALAQNHASSGGSVTVSRFDSRGLLANYDLRIGPQNDEVSGQFLAPPCAVDVVNRPAASCR